MKNLLTKINTDYVIALKSGDKIKTNLVRSLKNVISNAQIEKRRELNDLEIIAIIRKEINKREESHEIFHKNGRDDLAVIEKSEMDFLGAYLPAEISDDDLNKVIIGVIGDLNATSKKQMGDVIKAVAQKLGGAADGKRISLKVKDLLP